MKYAKTLADDNVFHPLLKCLLGRIVSMATGQCQMTLCQIVTEFVLPDLWKVTRLPGNYETPEVFACKLVSLLTIIVRNKPHISAQCCSFWHILTFASSLFV